MKTIEKNGATVDAAIESALKELGCGKDDVEIEVISAGKRGFFGLGSVEAKVRVTLKEKEEVKIEEEKYPEIKPVNERPSVEEYLSDILSHMGIDASLEKTEDEGSVTIDISGDLMGVVIGRRGDTLDALQYLCSLVHNKGREEYVRVNLDTENYRAKREETLVNLAKRIAGTVSRTGRSITLEPMNPNERRIIHSTLQAYEDINTYSIGEDPNRKIVVASKNSARHSRGYKRNYSSSYQRSESRYRYQENSEE